MPVPSVFLPGVPGPANGTAVLQVREVGNLSRLSLVSLHSTSSLPILILLDIQLTVPS